jgi:transcriptional regulator with GAF, ATPase, and Fis domain
VSAEREREITRAFVSLVNSLVDRFDVVDLLDGLTADCARLLDVDSAVLLLADQRGTLHLVAASSERARTLELLQIQRDQGPCLDCYREGTPVSVADLRTAAARWPQFAAAAAQAGFVSVHALPMRLRGTVLGALGLFGTQVGRLNDDDLSLGQALAHVASVAIVQDKAATDQLVVNEQLQGALTSRIALEQAKGFLAQQGGFGMDEAFGQLRTYARDHNLRLTDVARAVVARDIPAQRLLDHAATRAARPRRAKPS